MPFTIPNVSIVSPGPFQEMPYWYHPLATHDGTSANDYLLGKDDRDDRMYGDGGLDHLAGGGGDDKLYAHSNNGNWQTDGSRGDLVAGRNGTLLNGGEGDDFLSVQKGATGAFKLEGALGEDILSVSGGSQVGLSGGDAGDTFQFNDTFYGHAVVHDFNVEAGDRIRVEGVDAFWMDGFSTVILTESDARIEIQNFDYHMDGSGTGWLVDFG